MRTRYREDSKSATANQTTCRLQESWRMIEGPPSVLCRVRRTNRGDRDARAVQGATPQRTFVSHDVSHLETQESAIIPIGFSQNCDIHINSGVYPTMSKVKNRISRTGFPLGARVGEASEHFSYFPSPGSRQIQ